ncbi:MAG: XrtA/PEP-CTERM system TPR-repeat protein PrsT [Anaerolineales bacterium]
MRGVILFLSLALLISCDSVGSLTDKEHVIRAQEFLDKGELHAASIELKNALQQNPENSQARWLLGNTYLKLGNGPTAEKELRRAPELGVVEESIIIPLGKSLLLQEEYSRVISEIQPLGSLSVDTRAQIHALRGDAFLGEGKLDEASDEFQSAMDIKEDLAEAQLGHARVALVSRKPEEARIWIKKVLEDSPPSADAWSLLGDLEAFEGKNEEADDAYGKAIALAPNNSVHFLKRAMARLSLKDYKGAASDLETLNRRLPSHPAIAYTQGLLHFQQEQYSEAQEAFENTLKYNPNDMNAVFYLGMSHAAQGHIEQGEMFLSRFLSAYPNSSTAAKALGTVLLQKGNYAGAEAVLAPVLERDPNDAVALNLLGEIALPQGKSKEAVGYFRRVIAQQPDFPAAHMKLGMSLLMADMYEETVQELTAATEAEPQLQRADYLTILAHLKANEADKAIAAAERLREKQPDNPHPLTLMAGAYLLKDDEAKARELLHQALQVLPGDPSAADNLARLELKKGDLEKARSLYEEILKHHPAHTKTLVTLAQMDARQGHIKEAMARLEYAVKQNPEASRPRVLLASYYLRTGKPSRVLDIVRKAPDANTNPFMLGVTGEAQLALGEAANAKATFIRLVDIAPKSERAHYLLGKAYVALNQVDDASREFGKALEINPGYALAKVSITRLYLRSDQPEEAGKLLSELEQASPSHPEVLALRGELALRQGRPQQAIEAYKKAIELAPSSRRTMMLGIAQWQADDKDGSIETYKKWLEKYPSDSAVSFHLANSYLLLGHLDKAKSGFAKVVELAPDNALAYNNLAWLLREEDPAKALEYAERALELVPGDPLVMDTLGELLLDQGQSERPLRLFRHASEKAPSNLDIRYHLAQALVRNGDKAEAHQILEEVLEEQKPFANKQAAEALLKSLGG